MNESKLESTFPILTELSLYVLSFLNFRDLQSFSLVSHQCRTLAFPFIFRSLDMTVEAISAFEAGGRLNSICSSVRHVTLNSQSCYDYFRRCLPGLALFPNINSIKIYYKYHRIRQDHSGSQKWQSRVLDLTLFSAIFVHLSTLPFYSRLRYLYFTADQEDSLTDSDSGFKFSDEINPISPEAKAFLKVSVNIIKRNSRAPYPPALEELIIDTPFLFLPPVDKLHFGTILTDSTVTLKKLHLKSALIPPHAERERGSRKVNSYLHFPIFPLAPTVVFPNVTILSLAYDYISPKYFQEVVVRFPNVEELKVCLGRSTTPCTLRSEEGEAYPFMDRMTHLRRLVIPWKQVDPWRRDIFQVYLSKSKLYDTVLDWVYRANLERLEDVFIWKREFSKPVIDALHFTVTKDPRLRYKVDAEEKVSETLEGLLCGRMDESFGFKPDL
ncbi:hypothetical protein AA313_de0201113 [Arthrobotrys entomopaga]|nr:hypothetical protein AA313_de0201113 [Arthrobotrys entomopaga]